MVVQIVETMRDYMSDYQTYLNASLVELLVKDLLDAFLVAYLTALANTQKLRIPAATEQIRPDITEAFKFLSTLKPAKELESYFEVVEMVLALLEASKSLAFLSFWSFAKVHGPNLAFVDSECLRSKKGSSAGGASSSAPQARSKGGAGAVRGKGKERKTTDAGEGEGEGEGEGRASAPLPNALGALSLGEAAACAGRCSSGGSNRLTSADIRVGDTRGESATGIGRSSLEIRQHEERY
jgi:hypothetical protein